MTTIIKLIMRDGIPVDPCAKRRLTVWRASDDLVIAAARRAPLLPLQDRHEVIALTFKKSA